MRSTSPSEIAASSSASLYQLFRLQLLADAMERTHELGADVVRVVVAACGRNRALARDPRPWPTVLKDPARFALLDTDDLLGSGRGTTDEYRSRYG